MAYETQCGGCTYYDFQGDNCKGYCSWYKAYYYPGDSCSHQKPREASGSCYITTIICNVLGFDDHCPVLDDLREFRDHVMQKSENYKDLLQEYDSIGPDIAYFIEKEYEKTQDKEMWIQFYNFYLVPTANFVKKKEYHQAVYRYQEMVMALKEYFGIRDDVRTMVPNYDYTQGGHGKVKIK